MTTRVHEAVFEREHELLEAVSALRARGVPMRDIYCPYPVHGLAELVGLRPSRLPWAAAVAGFGGAAAILLFQIWTSAVDWPLNVGGKPFNSLPAFIPATFEVGVLLAGLTLVAAFLGVSRLYPGKRVEPFHAGVTDHRFVVVIEEPDGRFAPDEIRRLADSLGAVAVEDYLEAEEARS